MEPRIKPLSEQKKPVSLKAERAKRSIILNELAKLHGVELDSDVAEDIVNLKRFESVTSLYLTLVVSAVFSIVLIGLAIISIALFAAHLIAIFMGESAPPMVLPMVGLAAFLFPVVAYRIVTYFILSLKQYKIYRKLKNRYQW